MSILDMFRKKAKIKEVTIQKDTIREEIKDGIQTGIKDDIQTEIKTQDIDQDNTLSGKIKLNFKKFNLDKPDVLESTIFLLDVSGSMNEVVGVMRKIDHLRNVMQEYSNARKMCFSTNVSNNFDESIPEPNGGTDLARALRQIRKIISENNKDKLPKKIVLISDGEPDNETRAIDEASKLLIPIDIVYIGNKGDKGEMFMERLAERTGGKHFNV